MSAFGGKADIGLRDSKFIVCRRGRATSAWFHTSTFPHRGCAGLVPRPEPANF